MNDKHDKGGRKPDSADFRKLPPGQIPAKEAALLENRLIHGKTLADSALEAGYQCTSRDSAKNQALRVLNRHRDPNGELMKALQKVGVTVERLAQIIADGLKAEVAVKSGSDVVMVADHSTRHKYLESALDIVGGRAPKRIEVENITFEQRLRQITMKETPESSREH